MLVDPHLCACFSQWYSPNIFFALFVAPVVVFVCLVVFKGSPQLTLWKQRIHKAGSPQPCKRKCWEVEVKKSGGIRSVFPRVQLAWGTYTHTIADQCKADVGNKQKARWKNARRIHVSVGIRTQDPLIRWIPPGQFCYSTMSTSSNHIQTIPVLKTFVDLPYNFKSVHRDSQGPLHPLHSALLHLRVGQYQYRGNSMSFVFGETQHALRICICSFTKVKAFLILTK